MNQKECVVEALASLGGMATLFDLYHKTDISTWGSKTPFASIRRIVQTNKEFYNVRAGLCELVSLSEIYKFSYEDIVKRAKTIDTIWFNERNLPNSFYEVEHSTDFKNSLNKFYELQDFNARMFIVADKMRQREYESILRANIYEQIAQKVKFASYEDISRQLERESEQAFIKMGI